MSAKTDESLIQKIEDLLSWLANSEHLDQSQAGSLLSNISYTLNTGRSHFNHRLSLVVHSIADFEHTLQSIVENQHQDNYFKDRIDHKKNLMMQPYTKTF